MAEIASMKLALRHPVVMALAGLLALQLLVAVFSSGGPRLAPATHDRPLAEFSTALIDQIDIDTPDSATPLVLTRSTESGWILPSLGDFPADQARIEQLLHSLAELRRPLPMATSAAARQRFKVDDEVFEQRIVLKQGDQVAAQLILGDSPGFRRRYLRPVGDEGVYEVRFEVLNLSAQPDDWIARDQLRLERDQIQRLAADDWSLTSTDGTWTLEGETGELDAAKVEGLINTLANLSYRGVLGTEAPAGFDPASPRLALEVTLSDGAQRHYLLGAGDETEDAVLKLAERPYYFRLADFDLGPLAGLKPGDLLKAAPEASPAEHAED